MHATPACTKVFDVDIYQAKFKAVDANVAGSVASDRFFSQMRQFLRELWRKQFCEDTRGLLLAYGVPQRYGVCGLPCIAQPAVSALRSYEGADSPSP
jgi:hypothetical protein